MGFRQKLFHLIDEDSKDNKVGRAFNSFIIFLIFLNVVAIILESVESFKSVFQGWFDTFEAVSVLVFTFEYMGRLITAKYKYPHLSGWRPYVRYFFSFMALVDLLAIFPSVLIVLAPVYSPLKQLIDLRFIRMLRVLRLFRIFKITRYSSSLKMIGEILREKRRDLSVTIFITFILIVISSTLMYYAEHDAQEEEFPNIIAAFWWAVATLTTVGYGDVFPVTVMGKVLSGVIAILGIGMVALPTGILSSAFIERIEEEKQAKMKAEGGESEKPILQTAAEHDHTHLPYDYCPYCGEKLPDPGEIASKSGT